MDGTWQMTGASFLRFPGSGSIAGHLSIFGLVALLATATFIAVAPLSWLLVTLALVVATILALIYPWLLWFLLAFALPITSALRIGPGSATDILLLLSLGICFVAFVSGSRRAEIDRPPLWSTLLYLFVL